MRRWEQYPQTRQMNWGEKWAMCQQNQTHLNEYERGFLTDLRDKKRYWDHDLVSNKQLDLLDKIYDRLGELRDAETKR